MAKICLDLNVWCAAFLAERAGRSGTACQSLVTAIRAGPGGGPIQLVVSWGMLERLARVLVDQLGFDRFEAAELTGAIAGYAETGPSLTLGGVGVIPITDTEDRHVLETAWAGEADILATANLSDFAQQGDELILEGRLFRLRRGRATMLLAHPIEAATWLRDGRWRST